MGMWQNITRKTMEGEKKGRNGDMGTEEWG